MLKYFRRCSGPSMVASAIASLGMYNANGSVCRTFCASAADIPNFPIDTVIDNFNGVNVKLGSISDPGGVLLRDPAAFREALQSSLRTWKSQRYRAVWLKKFRLKMQF